MNRIRRRISGFLMAVVLTFCSVAEGFTVQAEKQVEYPMCYGKFKFNNAEEHTLPIIIHKKTVYVNLNDFETSMNFTVSNYQSQIESLYEKAIKKAEEKLFSKSQNESILKLLLFNVNNVSEEFNSGISVVTDLKNIFISNIEKKLENQLEEVSDAYVLKRFDSNIDDVSWYIDVDSKKIVVQSKMKTLLTYTMEAPVIETKENPENGIWIPFDALGQILGFNWVINEDVIEIGELRPYTEEYIYSDFDKYFCDTSKVLTKNDLLNDATESMAELLDNIGDGLQAASSLNIKEIYRINNRKTSTDEFEYLINAICFTDELELQNYVQYCQEITQECIPVINTSFGEEPFKGKSIEFMDSIEYHGKSLKLGTAISEMSDVIDITANATDFIIDAALTYKHVKQANKFPVEALTAYYDAYKKHYCKSCCGKDCIICIACENEIDILKNHCGSVSCSCMKIFSEKAKLYDNDDWQKDYLKYVTQNFSNTMMQTAGSAYFSGTPILSNVAILNAGWIAVTDLVNSGTNMMDYYEAIGYLGPAGLLEIDSKEIFEEYREKYKVENDPEQLKKLAYMNLKSYYIAHSEAKAVYQSSSIWADYSSKIENENIILSDLASILPGMMLSEQMPNNYEEYSEEIIASKVLCQKVTGEVISESDEGKYRNVTNAVICFKNKDKEYVFKTNQNGNIISQLGDVAYLPKDKYTLVITSAGNEEYTSEVEVTLEEECALGEIILKQSERMPMIANFYVGADFNNLMCDGAVTESSKYVYYNTSEYGSIYRYDKSDGTTFKLSNDGGKYLNVSEDEYLYFVDSDEEIYKINGITGEKTLFLETSDWRSKNNLDGYFSEITNMILINDELYVLFTGQHHAMLIAIDSNTAEMKCNLDSWSDSDDKLYLEFAFVAAEEDTLYYSWRKADGTLRLYGCNINDYTIAERLMYSENGEEINQARYYTAYGYDSDYSYDYSYDIPCYDLRFWDAVSYNGLYSFTYTFNYNNYTVYDFFTDSYYEPNEQINSIKENTDDWVINRILYHEGMFYVMTDSNIMYAFSEELTSIEEFYNADNIFDEYGENISWNDWEYGVADDAIWLINDYCTRRISIDGTESTIDNYNVELIENPNTIFGTAVTNDVVKVYAEPCWWEADILYELNNGEIIAVIKGIRTQTNMIGLKDFDYYYQVELSDGTTGYVKREDVNLSAEIEEYEFCDIVN